MQWLDYGFLILYFVAVAGIGYWSSRKSLDSSNSYFLGGRSIGWMAIGASLFSSNISAEHFIGLAGTGAESGLAVGQFEWLACFILLLLGWLFVPFYLKTGVFTMPEFLEQRYNAHCRTYLSAISLVAYIFTKVSVAVYAGALVLQTIMGWDMYTGAIILVIATGIYTMFGGLRAVIYTDFFQAGVLILGGVILTAMAVVEIGGFSVMTSKFPEYFNLWKPASHPEFPWTGILFGAPILGVWYWCTDQMIVQRTLAANHVEDARRATIFAGFLKILPVFILVLPGIAGHILYPNTPADKMYAMMVNQLLPVGVKGLVIAALLAALMSSLSAVFNSSSTLIVMDFYKKWYPQASEKRLVVMGQIATVVLVVAGLLWIPFIGKMSSQLYIYLQSVQAYISPPIAAIFLLGILWKRANGKGALSALLLGFILGASRFISELAVKADWANMGMGWVSRVGIPSYSNLWYIHFIQYFATINFLHFAIILFVVSLVVMVIVSKISAPPTEDKLVMFAKVATASSETQVNPEQVQAYRTNIGLSIILAGVVLACWVFFSHLFF